MKNGARYVVQTHWGTFSLDEGAYQDYLKGKLWISWLPGKPTVGLPNADEQLPSTITDRAVELREAADKKGVLSVLSGLRVHDAILPYSTRLDDLSIDELLLTARSTNGLKRANAGTFGRLRKLMAAENGIMSVRNLGQKSAEEIKQQFIAECYTRLKPYEKAQYWQDVLDRIEKA